MPSTTRTYSSIQRKYFTFCQKYGLIPLPASEMHILRFIAYISETVSFNSMQVYLAAIRALHVYQNLPVPLLTTPRIQLALKSLSHHAPEVKQALPITFAIMQGFRSLLAHTMEDMSLWTCMTVLFFGCRRAGEIAPSNEQMSMGFKYPRVCDLAFSPNPPAAILTISRTKTQPKGFTLVLGCSGSDICPYCALVKYLSARGITDTQVNPGPLFVLNDGSPLNKDYLMSRQKVLLHTLGINSKGFTPHSYRSGGATQLALNGVSEFWVQKSGQWKSMCYRRYIRESITTQAGLTRLFVPPSS